MLLDEYILLALETQFNNVKEQDLQNLLDKYMKNADASKAAFMASPTSCFLANRNKPGAASAATDQSVKNESLVEPIYMSLSTQPQSLDTSTAVYQGTESSGFTVSGGQMDLSQVSAPLMTPPISPAALVNRGSVINQGPMAGRPLGSSSTSSSCSSSCLSSLSVMTQPNPCSSYQENLFHCVPQTSSSCYPPPSASLDPGYQAVHRSHTQSHCLASVQSQASSLAYHLSRYPSFNDQHLAKDVFFNSGHHQASIHHSFNSYNGSMTPYYSAIRPVSSYSSGSDPVQAPDQGLDNEGADQTMDSAESYGFVGGGLNASGGDCQGQSYTSPGHNAGYYGNSSYLDTPRMTSLVDQHVSVISSVSSLRPFPPISSEVHDPLNILDDPGRKTSGAYYMEVETGADHSQFSASAPCMYGGSSQFSSQDALFSQHGTSSSEVREVSLLPPINTVFMDAGAAP